MESINTQVVFSYFKRPLLYIFGRNKILLLFIFEAYTFTFLNRMTLPLTTAELNSPPHKAASVSILEGDLEPWSRERKRPFSRADHHFYYQCGGTQSHSNRCLPSDHISVKTAVCNRTHTY